MRCPKCHEEAGFRLIPGTGVDPDTGYRDGDMWQCQNNHCAEVFDESDLDAECIEQARQEAA